MNDVVSSLDGLTSEERDKRSRDHWTMLGSLEAQLGSKALAKACVDPWLYAARIRTGECIRFKSASVIAPGWVHLDGACLAHNPFQHDEEREFQRGIDVRVSDILWVADRPEKAA